MKWTVVLLAVSLALCQAGKKDAGKKAVAQTIEDVDEERIDEIIDDGDTHLVIFFYDNKAKCPECPDALREMEEIDDDIEEDGLIEVVKCDDRDAMEDFGIVTLPALVYLRREHPILYDGSFGDSEKILRWILSHDDVVCYELDDDDFEETTDVSDPDDDDKDWLIMFYDEEDDDCSSFEAMWETVAHKLRGMVKVGKVDVNDADDVADRFDIDDEDECPEFYLFHNGKMYRYVDPALDIKSFVAFALHRYKEQRGHRIPDPPTALEDFLEDIKEDIEDFLDDHSFLFYLIVFLGIGGALAYALRKWRKRKAAVDEDAAPNNFSVAWARFKKRLRQLALLRGEFEPPKNHHGCFN